jgi:hypothetical protein
LLVLEVLEFELRASHLLGRHSTIFKETTYSAIGLL